MVLVMVLVFQSPGTEPPNLLAPSLLFGVSFCFILLGVGVLSEITEAGPFKEAVQNARKLLNLSWEEFANYPGQDLSKKAAAEMEDLAGKFSSAQEKTSNPYHPDVLQAQSDFEQARRDFTKSGLIEKEPHASYFE